MGVVYVSVETTLDEFEIRVESATADYSPADRSVGVMWGGIDGVWDIKGEVYVYDEEGEEYLLEEWEVLHLMDELLEACNNENAEYDGEV